MFFSWVSNKGQKISKTNYSVLIYSYFPNFDIAFILDILQSNNQSLQEDFKYCLDVLRHFAAPISASSQPTPQTIFLNIAKKTRSTSRSWAKWSGVFRLTQSKFLAYYIILQRASDLQRCSARWAQGRNRDFSHSPCWQTNVNVNIS